MLNPIFNKGRSTSSLINSIALIESRSRIKKKLPKQSDLQKNF